MKYQNTLLLSYAAFAMLADAEPITSTVVATMTASAGAGAGVAAADNQSIVAVANTQGAIATGASDMDVGGAASGAKSNAAIGVADSEISSVADSYTGIPSEAAVGNALPSGAGGAAGAAGSGALGFMTPAAAGGAPSRAHDSDWSSWAHRWFRDGKTDLQGHPGRPGGPSPTKRHPHKPRGWSEWFGGKGPKGQSTEQHVGMSALQKRDNSHEGIAKSGPSWASVRTHANNIVAKRALALPNDGE